MKPPRFEYVRATGVDDALRVLADGDAQPLAGGQSLVPAMNLRVSYPTRLVDLNAIAELGRIDRLPNGDFVAGAMARHRDFELSASIRAEQPLLAHAMRGVAHVAIRNRGTIGGSLAHADPAADWPALCLACDATLTLRSLDGARDVSAEAFNRGTFETDLRPGEMIVAVRFPRWPDGRRWGLRKLARRHGDYAIVGVTVVLDRDPDGRCRDVRIVLQGVADRPVVAHEACRSLRGQRIDPALACDAARIARGAAEPGSDLHASAALRSTLVETLTRRALGDALELDLETMEADDVRA